MWFWCRDCEPNWLLDSEELFSKSTFCQHRILLDLKGRARGQPGLGHHFTSCSPPNADRGDGADRGGQGVQEEEVEQMEGEQVGEEEEEVEKGEEDEEEQKEEG